MKIITKIFRKLGFVPHDKFAEELKQLALVSMEENGNPITIIDFGIEFTVSAKTLQMRLNERGKAHANKN